MALSVRSFPDGRHPDKARISSVPSTGITGGDSDAPVVYNAKEVHGSGSTAGVG